MTQADKRRFFAVPKDALDSDADIYRLATQIWEAFTGLRVDDGERDTTSGAETNDAQNSDDNNEGNL